MKPDITKELLFDHFTGNVSARQRRLIDEWARRPENEDIFYKHLVEWEMSRPQYQVDLQKGISKFRSTLDNTEDALAEAAEPMHPLNSRRRQRWYAAACAILAIAACGWLFQKELRYRDLSTGPGEIRSWTLDDGSKVNLNANSELTVPRWGFGADYREVYLKGEAEFVVTHQTNGQRFIVKTNDGIDVVVLGTEFTVYSRPDKTQILLNKGKVRVQHQQGKQREEMVMAPGDMITVKSKGNILRNRFKEPAEYAAWKESRFVFNKTSLSEIAQLLENNYNLTVEITQPEIAALTVSGSFKALDHHELINSISQILDIRYKLKGRKVTFSQDIQTAE